MNRLKKLFLGLCLPLVFLLSGCGNRSGAAPDATPIGQPESPTLVQEIPGAIAANGIIVPAAQIDLSFRAGGRVEELAVKAGDFVEAGQLLARLDASSLERAVARAEADLALAQAQLAQIQAGPREEAVAAAESNIAAAEADLVAAGASLTAAQASLAQAERGLAYAEENYDRAWDPGRDWELQVKERAEQLEIERESTERALAEARDNLEVAQADHAAAQMRVRAAQARLEEVQALREAVAAGATGEEIAVLQARVDQARLKLEWARADLANSELKAPLAGVVTKVMIRTGETVSAGQEALELADTSRWWVETNNVGELEISRVKVGQEARVAVNAFLGEELVGTVVAVSPTAVVQHGDTTYTVMVELQETGLDLRWGMTAQVSVVIED